MIQGIIGFLVLVFLPGAWVTFPLPFSGFPAWSKFLVGAALSPVVVFVQFYALRLLGASFELTAYLLVALNLPVLYWVVGELHKLSVPDRRTLFAGLVVVLVPLSFLWVQFSDVQARAYSGHAWMHADAIYMLANGDLLVEEPELAGVVLGYPWAGHVYQGVLSYLLSSPPVSNYFWTNLFWLLLIYGFAASLVTEFGGNLFSRATSVIWLSFGVNFAGYVLAPVLFPGHAWILVDDRYTPWLRKFFFFEQLPLALGMFIALVFLATRKWSNDLAKSPLAASCLLLCGIGIFYPIMFPPACAVVGAKAIATVSDKSAHPGKGPHKQLLALAIVFLIGLVVTFANLSVLFQDRVSQGVVEFSEIRHLLAKALRTVVVLSPLLAGLAFVFARCWKTRRSAMIVLTLGTLANCILYVVFHIPNYHNEYKYVFSAAICLSPFSALALEPLMKRLGRLALPVFGLATLILAAPLAQVMYRRPWWPSDNVPRLDSRSFNLRLAGGTPLARIYDAVREQTPTESILVVESTELHLPTLTRRKMYVSPSRQDPRPGINLVTDYQLTAVRGYDRHIIESRRSAVSELFNSPDGDRRTQSLEQILAFGRPVAIILDLRRHAGLIEWLRTEAKGICLHRASPFVVWFIDRTVPSGTSTEWIK